MLWHATPCYAAQTLLARFAFKMQHNASEPAGKVQLQSWLLSQGKLATACKLLNPITGLTGS